LHPTFQGLSLEEIFDGILFREKDVPENTNVTFQWLQSQPDYQTQLPYYLNKYFGKKDTSLEITLWTGTWDAAQEPPPTTLLTFVCFFFPLFLFVCSL
jgi:hypothetical protein